MDPATKQVKSNNPINFCFDTNYESNVNISFTDGTSVIRGDTNGGLNIVNGPLTVDNLSLSPVCISSTSDLLLKVGRIKQHGEDIFPLVDLHGTRCNIETDIPAFRFSPGSGTFKTLAEFNGNVYTNMIETTQVKIGDEIIRYENDQLILNNVFCNKLNVDNLQFNGNKFNVIEPRLTFFGMEDFRLVPNGKHVSFTLFGMGESWTSPNVEALQIGTSQTGFRISSRIHGAGKKNQISITTNTYDQISLDNEGVHIMDSFHIGKDIQFTRPVKFKGLKSGNIDVDRIHFPTLIILEKNNEFVVRDKTKDFLTASSKGLLASNTLSIRRDDCIVTLGQSPNSQSYELLLPDKLPETPSNLSIITKDGVGKLVWEKRQNQNNGTYEMLELNEWQDLPNCLPGDGFYYDIKLKIIGENSKSIFTFAIAFLDTWDILDMKTISKGKSPTQISVDNSTGQIKLKTNQNCSIDWIIN
jgi:hypothetical protein